MTPAQENFLAALKVYLIYDGGFAYDSATIAKWLCF